MDFMGYDFRVQQPLLNIAVAEEIYGWNYWNRRWYDMAGNKQALRDWAGDTDNAIELALYVRKIWQYRMKVDSPEEKGSNLPDGTAWVITFYDTRISEDIKDAITKISASASTMKEAIVRAALAVAGVVVE